MTTEIAAKPPSGFAIEKYDALATGQLLDDLQCFLLRFLVLPEPLKAVLPLWVLHTSVYTRFRCTPYLHLKSPEPGCGKSIQASLLTHLCHGVIGGKLSGTAASIRAVFAQGGTVIIDEYDTLDESVRKAVTTHMNTGFEKGGNFAMQQKGETVLKPTYCPKAIIGIDVPMKDSLRTRCLTYVIHRGKPSERWSDELYTEEAEELKCRCVAWGAEFLRLPVIATPEFPEHWGARQRDIAEPLLTIASLSGTWAYKAAQALSQTFAKSEVVPDSRRMLIAVDRFLDFQSKVNSLCQGQRPTWFWTEGFVSWLSRDEEWQGQNVNADVVADMLRRYEIEPEQINRTVGGVARNRRGYLTKNFEFAFKTYL